ncbi:hypothetical protein B0T17DRAFT_621351 [Bombardia bombarda]|uniref:Uncharacterized protein n=1 Tax=Bombardia bombarda TaxID=252184 RepID=A0AA39W3Y9_9PEZI|nr:hypothetical protein B0T17DRAFT_621351 [Bombardia bombarda]
MASFSSRASSLSPKCQASIAASTDYLDCQQGRLSVPPESTLFSLLGQCFEKFTSSFALTDKESLLSDPSSLERMLSSIFDTESQAFVTEKSLRILAGLNDHDKSCLFLQAVAGMAMIFQRLTSASSELSRRIFSRELQLFAESEERRNMLEKISSSRLLSSCYTKSEVVSFVTKIIEDRESGHHDNVPLNEAGEDFTSDGVTWVGNRPLKNMGLPWGFTIMALN